MYERESEVEYCFVLCANKKYSGLFSILNLTVTIIQCLDMLEKFLMPISKEDSPDDILFQQDRVFPHFHREVMGFLNYKFREVNGPGWTYLLATLFTWLFPLIYFLGGYMKDVRCCICHHWYHFTRTGWEDILLILPNCFIVYF
jgi:hypothetical protein